MPVSKTDQRPLAAVARGGCTCRGRELEADCVYHACADRARLLHAHLGHTAGDPLLSALPLFPTQNGVTVALAELLGVLTVSEQGAQLFGGHSFRLTGAQWLGSLGFSVDR